MYIFLTSPLSSFSKSWNSWWEKDEGAESVHCSSPCLGLGIWIFFIKPETMRNQLFSRQPQVNMVSQITSGPCAYPGTQKQQPNSFFNRSSAFILMDLVIVSTVMFFKHRMIFFIFLRVNILLKTIADI